MTLKEVLAMFGVTQTDEEIKAKVGDRKIFVAEGEFVPKSRLDEVLTQNKEITDQVKDREAQITNLKASAKGNEELTKKIEELEATNKKASEDYELKLATYKLDSAIDQELASAGARDVKAVRATVDLSEVKFDKNGKVSGLTEIIDESKKNKEFLWNVDRSNDHAGKGREKENGSKDEFDEMRKIR